MEVYTKLLLRVCMMVDIVALAYKRPWANLVRMMVYIRVQVYTPAQLVCMIVRVDYKKTPLAYTLVPVCKRARV